MSELFKHYDIKNNIQLLFDNEFLDDCWNLRRAPELPVKSYRNPVLYDKPPYEPGGATILYDSSEKVFKCWYGVADTELYYAGLPGAYRMCYAVSEDGMTWERVRLGLIENRGSRDNNIFFNHPGAVYRDEHETNPEKRYKMLYLGEKVGLCAAFSADGIHWNKNGGRDVEIIFGSNDTNNAAFYVPEEKKYVRYGRVNILASIEKEEALGIKVRTSPDIIRYTDIICSTNPYRTTPPKENFPDYDDFVEYHEAQDYVNRYMHSIPYEHGKILRKRGSTGCNRRIVRSESSDFIHWSTPELVIAPDELDPSKLYGMTACIYEGVYIGLLQVFNMNSQRRTMGDAGYGDGDTIDLQLTFSRDGKNWGRLANRPNFIPRGYVGSYDGGMVFGTNNVLIEHGDDLLFYYHGTVASHTVNLDTVSSICVARVPKGRLISRCAGDEMGALITKPFVMKHDRIALNLDSRRGVARVEITDLEGNPVAGFKATECAELKLNSLDCIVTWNGNAGLKALKGRTIRLRIYLWQSKLYSINFKD